LELVTINYGFIKDNGAGINTGSWRLRGLHKIEQLKEQGKTAELFDSSHNYDAVVFVKAFKIEHSKLARHLKNNDTRIIFDICDNHFEEYGELCSVDSVNCCKLMAHLADEIWVPTQALKEIIDKYYPGKQVIIQRDIVDKYPYDLVVGVINTSSKYKLEEDLINDIEKLNKEDYNIKLKIITGFPEHNTYENDFIEIVKWELNTYLHDCKECDVLAHPLKDVGWCKTKSCNKIDIAAQIKRPIIVHSFLSDEGEDDKSKLHTNV